MLGALSDLDLRLIRVFLAIVDAGGISMAQGALNVGQSTISTQLATLETRLGFRLCERGRSGFRLTAKGERFETLARDLIGAVEEFGMQARNMDRKLVGNLRIGMIGHTPFSENSRISHAIARFRKRDQAVRMIVTVCSPGAMEEQLMNGELDIAIGYFWNRSANLHFTPLFLERQVAYCGSKHPLFGRADSVTMDEAWECEWAWRSYPLPDSLFSAPPRQVTAIADNMEALAMLVLSGHHLAFLPQHFAQTYVRQGLMAPLAPRQLHYEVTFSVVTRQRRHVSEIARAFLDDLAIVHLETPPVVSA
ncbi:transcriptional regulator [Acetobacter estunensis NRIC 0472]|uniref:LysR family transcriptional regulator n=1 Tax=Acetobacter estunensis TaxID=104097 RepID=A0A967BBE2_9PROT|nr:LysR family transcriptional regulator [Acetobacter estunensis]NHO53252.1 LysR family transcriptional regulator [Acetobacter estunensis]GBQ23684.1 transcriptional regulator [Acetobacter estunensis NRIC 0472]